MATSELTAIEFASRLAAGGADPSTLQWVQAGMAAWVRAGGEIPLERCLHLPRSPTSRRKMKRVEWVQIAANQLDAKTDWGICTGLAAELNQFLSRGPWFAWKNMKNPPAEASNLRTALFHIAQMSDGKPLAPRTFYRDLRQLSK